MTECAESPRYRWRVGPYEFQRYARSQDGPGSRGRWGCNSRGRGVANYRTPIGAFFAMLRWQKVPARPVEE
jgi:hypothetical protein